MRIRGHHERLLRSHNRERDASKEGLMHDSSRVMGMSLFAIPPQSDALLISFSQRCRAHHVNYFISFNGRKGTAREQEGRIGTSRFQPSKLNRIKIKIIRFDSDL